MNNVSPIRFWFSAIYVAVTDAIFGRRRTYYKDVKPTRKFGESASEDTNKKK